MASSKRKPRGSQATRRRRQQIAALDDTYLECREVMHAWQQTAAYVYHRERGVTKVVMQQFVCTRCGTERHDRLWAATWELAGRRYIHPDGYLLDHAGFVRRAEIRQEKFTRHPAAEDPPGTEKIRMLRAGAV